MADAECSSSAQSQPTSVLSLQHEEEARIPPRLAQQAQPEAAIAAGAAAVQVVADSEASRASQQDSRFLHFLDDENEGCDEDAEGEDDPDAELYQPVSSQTASSSSSALQITTTTTATAAAMVATTASASASSRQAPADHPDEERIRDNQDENEEQEEEAEEEGDNDDSDDTPLALQISTMTEVRPPTPDLTQSVETSVLAPTLSEQQRTAGAAATAAAAVAAGVVVEDSYGNGEGEEDDSELEIEYEDDDDEEEGEEEGEEADVEMDPFTLEVAGLYTAVPILNSTYRVVEKLGEGTFSTVYKALPLLHSSSASSAAARSYRGLQQTQQLRRDQAAAVAALRGGNAFVALKRIYVSSSPGRIANELDILEELRGHEHISHLINIFRERDQVIAVMSYSEHVDFRDFYRILPMSDIRCYFRCLFSALAAVHEAQVIHRDVKPANFLYNPLTGHGTLCDFGLAERFDPDEWKNKCHHTCPTEHALHGEPRLNRAVPSSVYGAIEASAANSKYGGGGGGGGREGGTAGEGDELGGPHHVGHQPERVGYLREDTRQPVRANRAGTRGFRAPEVLLKCQDQTVAIDIWSAGVILLCMLTKRFPLFNADDDVVALLELGVLFGRKKMELCAYFHNRTFKTDIPDITDDGIKMYEFLRQLHPDPWDEIGALSRALESEPSQAASSSTAATSRRPPPSPLGESAAPSQRSQSVEHASLEDEAKSGSVEDPVDERVRRLARMKADWLGALDLVRICLNPIHTKRWPAERLLREHKFFNPPAAGATAAPSSAAAGRKEEREKERREGEKVAGVKRSASAVGSSTGTGTGMGVGVGMGAVAGAREEQPVVKKKRVLL
ncbi:Cell division control protein 7 [Tilletia horrida]|uniref:non-specific serine/threonine protein kinase n=1 Tax=Tilletia horrida TaxID=155126 RepID=A0AAN6G952_9BASI|nr:Cell division control protein 7 [Tilletia horrida]